MTLFPVLLALGLVANPAHAKKKKKKGDDAIGLRLKLSTDLMAVDKAQLNYDGQDVDNADTRTTTVGIFDTQPRFEATYTIVKNIEAGLIFGVSQQRGTAGDAEVPPSRHSTIGLTGAYNYGLGNGLQAFAQPFVLMDTSTAAVGEETETRVRFNMVGADVGVRWKAAKHVTLDLALEGRAGTGRTTVNGESDDKAKIKARGGGLRSGISVRF